MNYIFTRETFENFLSSNGWIKCNFSSASISYFTRKVEYAVKKKIAKDVTYWVVHDSNAYCELSSASLNKTSRIEFVFWSDL